MASTTCEEFIEEISMSKNIPYRLKRPQIEAITSILNGKDTLACLPTGFGKSDILKFVPLILDKQFPDIQHASLVISPLVALMADQSMAWTEQGFDSVILNTDRKDEITEGLLGGQYSIVLSSPEALNAWRDVLTKIHIAVIALVEVHVLFTWGKTFRPAYRAIRSLRAWFPQVPTLLLTATLTQEIFKDIKSHLGLADIKEIVLPSNRKNIYLDWSMSDSDKSLSWLTTQLAQDGPTMDKVIIFVRSQNLQTALFEHILSNVEDSVGKLRMLQTEDHVEMFHAELTEDKKSSIISEFRQPESRIRILIATIAFGMGVGIPDIRHVVHWGPSTDVLSYIQEIGHAGHDGLDATATLYLMPNCRCSDELKSIFKNRQNSCIRQTLEATLYLPHSNAPICGEATRCCSTCNPSSQNRA